MNRLVLGALGSLAISLPAAAQVQPFPADFRTQEIQANGIVLHVRVGGHGPAVVLLHGYGETGDMWAPLAAELARDHTVVAPDLRGMGLSSRPEGGYDKKTQGHDVAGVLDALKIAKADLESFSEAAREHYARLYAQPGAMHAGFNQFAAFDQDAVDNKAFVAHGKLTMPVLAVGGDKSFGPTMAVVMRAAASDVTELVIPNSGHWLMEEQPAATIAAIRAFLDRKS